MTERSYIAGFAQLPAAERIARLRALAVLTHVIAGPQSACLDLLGMAESNPKHLERAGALFDQLPTLRRRQILSILAVYLPSRRSGRDAA
jgi:hypothetical protein